MRFQILIFLYDFLKILLQLLINMTQIFKLTLFILVQLLDMLFDLNKSLLIRIEYLFLIFILCFEHTNFALKYGVSLHFILQFLM